jgi:hypothetical protein
MVKKKIYEIVKVGNEEYVYDVCPSDSVLSDLISGPIRKLEEVRIVKERKGDC